MTSKHVNHNQQEMFDGFAVSNYDGKFGAGSFELEEDLARDIGFDDVVVFCVTARVGTVGFTETKNGEMKRTNTFNVVESFVLDAQLADQLRNAAPGPGGQLRLGQEAPPAAEDTADVSTVGAPPDPNSAPVNAGEPVRDPELVAFLAGES